jgi:hypothetical protein
VPLNIWETVLHERCAEATQAQQQISAIENDGAEQGTPEKKARVAAILPADFKHMLEMINDNDVFRRALHSAAHEVVDGILEQRKEGHAACAVIMQAEAQMIILGWKVACAYLEVEALRNMT